MSQGLIWRGTGVQVMEHGGFGPDDISVPIIVSHPFLSSPGSTDSTKVYTTQIAPTIMQLLGLDPSLLQVWPPTAELATVRYSSHKWQVTFPLGSTSHTQSSTIKQECKNAFF